MTTTLDALKAAREALGRSLLRLRGPGDRDYAEACDYALTLLDAAIQREEGGGEYADPAESFRQLREITGDALDGVDPHELRHGTPTPPSGVVSREKVEMTEQEIDELLEECGSGMGEDGWPMGDAELRALIRNGVFADAPMPSVAARVIASHIALRAALSAPSEPSGQSEGVVSREAAEAACREAARMVGRFVSVPSEPMVPRAEMERGMSEAMDGYRRLECPGECMGDCPGCGVYRGLSRMRAALDGNPWEATHGE